MQCFVHPLQGNILYLLMTSLGQSFKKNNHISCPELRCQMRLSAFRKRKFRFRTKAKQILKEALKLDAFTQ